MEGIETAKKSGRAQEQWETMKKQWNEQWKQSGIRASAYVRW
jgi:hypothetical protein